MVITSIIITNVKIHCSKMEEPFCFFGRPCTNDYIQLLKEESMLERIKDLKTAVKIERDEELRNYESVINNQSIQERVKEGITLYPVEYVNERYNSFAELILEFKVNPDQDPYQFSANGRIDLFNGNNNEHFEGYIVSFKNHLLSVFIHEADTIEWLKSGKLGLNALPDTKTADVQIEALERILSEELRLPYLFYKNTGTDQYETRQEDFTALNSSQKIAANHCISENAFHIVHGPPGTGKTKTITQAILQLAKDGKRVMVAAPSNAAVDHITRELSKENEKVVRIGNSFKISDDILPVTLKQKILNDQMMEVVKRLKKEAELVRKKAFKYKRNFGKEAYQERKQLRQELKEIRKDIRRIEREMAIDHLKSAEIITGTFIGLQDKRLNDLEFDAIFVDEAGQAMEPSVWTIAHHANKLFLAGDPLQLPPTLFSSSAKELGLGISLIEKGIEQGIPTTLLDTQYRMNDTIMQFSNLQFYEAKLKSDETVATINLGDEPYAPVEFIDTAGCGYDEKNDDLGGIYNPDEAVLIGKRLAQLTITNESIGIISPYRKQVNYLKDLYPENDRNIQTIDSFQGQERDIIIISLVRSNLEGIIGFLSDYRRMNVAMTRARKKLIVIADSATIGSDKFYQDFLEYVETSGAYRSGWEYMD